jgi:N-acetylglucosaminyldiphosphoundecaprenol N-acetyl-beta-D-mannosaminyltransferase
MDDRSQVLAIRHVIIGGVPVAPLCRSDICSLIVGECAERRGGSASRRPTRLLFSANGHTLSLAARNSGFREALDQADLVHADGQSIVFASRLLRGGGIPERSATTDLIHDLSRVCPAEGLSFFLLGGTEDVNARCADALVRLYPGLKIAGRRNGYFPPELEHEICEEINASKADILWVGMGKPTEQLFCVRNRSYLDGAWAITCGGTFSFVVGDYRRAPLWMQSAGLEWFFRVLTSPRKLLWRYVTTNPHTLFLLATRTRATRGGQGRSDV